MNNAPFYVGQRVALTINNSTFGYRKGDVFTVLKCFFGCHCWFVDVGWVSPVSTDLSCNTCGKLLLLKKGGPFCPDAVIFVPVQEAYSDITAELASKVEVGDTADQPVRVLSN